MGLSNQQKTAVHTSSWRTPTLKPMNNIQYSASDDRRFDLAIIGHPTASWRASLHRDAVITLCIRFPCWHSFNLTRRAAQHVENTWILFVQHLRASRLTTRCTTEAVGGCHGKANDLGFTKLGDVSCRKRSREKAPRRDRLLLMTENSEQSGKVTKRWQK